MGNITLRFKGQIYDDGQRDCCGHIRFGGNTYEYVPADPKFGRYSPYIIIHGFKPIENGYMHVRKKSTAKVVILDDPDKDEK